MVFFGFCRWLLLFLLAMISPPEDLCLRFHIFTPLLNMVGYINDMSYVKSMKPHFTSFF